MDSIDETIESKYQGVALGDEGCVYPCLHKNVLVWAQKCKEQNKSVRFLTPIVPDRCMDDLVKQVEELSKIVKAKVTFNDFGLLYRCRTLIENGDIIAVLGRLLTRSMLDCNWAKRLLTSEEEGVIDELYDYSYIDREKITILEDYHISEIEVNYHPERIAELKKVVKVPITIYTNHLLSVGRVCFSAKYQQLELPVCVDCKECKKKLDFTVAKKWSKQKMSYSEPDQEFSGYMQGLYVQGNVIYRYLDLSNEMLDENVISEVIFEGTK